MQQKDNKRRQFLRNTSLAFLATSMLPNIGKSASNTVPNIRPDDASLACDKTTQDYYGEGPFYTDNPPTLTDNKLASENEVGTPLIISGRVKNLDCTEFIPNTIVDIWHANDAGAYDNDGYNLRGKVSSNEQGFYVFETILPGKYLNGNSYRPSHIHLKITPPDFPTLTTQIYFEGDTDIADDAAASITSGEYDATHRIISLTEDAAGQLEGNWDIVVDGDGVLNSVKDLHLERGMIYKISPNPGYSGSEIHIQYGVFKKAKITLLVYNIQGQLVATLEERELQPEKYTAIWYPNAGQPSGHYFVALKVNDLQVHYQKVVL